MEPLAHPLFRALWIASVASHIGSYMTDVRLGWLMTTLASSPLLVSLLLTAESLPFFALGLPAGALADIVDLRRLLIVTQIAMVVVLVVLAIVTLSGAVMPWMLLALAFSPKPSTSSKRVSSTRLPETAGFPMSMAATWERFVSCRCSTPPYYWWRATLAIAKKCETLGGDAPRWNANTRCWISRSATLMRS